MSRTPWRRTRCILGSLLFLLTGCSTPGPQSTVTRTVRPLIPPTVMLTSATQTVFDWATQRCSNDEHPDLPVRVFRDADGMLQMTISSPINYRLTGPTLDSLRPNCTPILVSAVDPDPSHYNAQSWLASTYTTDGQHVYAIVHEEYHADQLGAVWVADRDFSSTQGRRGWYYQGYDGVHYLDMTFDRATNLWKASQPLCVIGHEYMHQDRGCQPTLTWVSPINGTVTISGNAHNLTTFGEGVVASIVNGTTTLWTAPIANGDMTGRNFDLRVSVRIGDRIHFRLGPSGDVSWDPAYFNPSINIGGPACPSGDHNVCQMESLTYAYSTNGGKTFFQPPLRNRIIAAEPYQYNADAMRALWQPSNIVRNPNDGYYYALVQRDEHGPAVAANVQGTCVIRTQTLDDPSSWRAWDGTGFNMRFIDPYVTTLADPRQHTCALVSPAEIVALTYSLTYNTYFGKFVAVGVRADGFYYALSSDLVHWTPARFIMAAPAGFANGMVTPYYAYPSLVDPDSPTPNFDVTGQTPYLYYARFNSLSPLSIDELRVRIQFIAHR